MRRCLVVAAIGSLFLFGGCAVPPQEVTQVSTIDTLLAGAYDGVMSVGELKTYGTMGIGTFDRLDGELLLLDGTVYQLKCDGTASVPEDRVTVPFASVTSWTDGKTFQVPTMADYPAFLAFLDKTVNDGANLPMAFHFRGRFNAVRFRSVPPQTKPYPPLVQVTKTQPEFQLRDVEGDLVGFRLPPYVKGINVPGWYLHFITADRSRGGHLLALDVKEGGRRILPVARLPDDSSVRGEGFQPHGLEC